MENFRENVTRWMDAPLESMKTTIFRTSILSVRTIMFTILFFILFVKYLIFFFFAKDINLEREERAFITLPDLSVVFIC